MTQARQGAHAHLTHLAHLLNLPAAPLRSPHTPDHLFRRLTRFLLSKRYGTISRNAVEVPILGSWDVSTAESVGDRGWKGALCSPRCWTQETVALQGAESRSAPSSVLPADGERRLCRKSNSDCLQSPFDFDILTSLWIFFFFVMQQLDVYTHICATRLTAVF